MNQGPPLDLAKDGAQLFSGALTACLPAFETALAHLPHGNAGVRLHGLSELRPLLSPDGCVGAVAAGFLGLKARPVRAIFFNKSAENNWSLAWHQDRTICVETKRATPSFGPWTVKAGVHHVAPPFGLLANMITLRAHLDDVSRDNAPLLISPGTHKRGRISVEDVDRIVEEHGTAMCLAKAGDIWAYSTPIVHSSQVAASPGSRRVLQVDYAAERLPNGLEWLGV